MVVSIEPVPFVIRKLGVRIASFNFLDAWNLKHILQSCPLLGKCNTVSWDDVGVTEFVPKYLVVLLSHFIGFLLRVVDQIPSEDLNVLFFILHGQDNYIWIATGLYLFDLRRDMICFNTLMLRDLEVD